MSVEQYHPQHKSLPGGMGSWSAEDTFWLFVFLLLFWLGILAGVIALIFYARTVN